MEELLREKYECNYTIRDIIDLSSSKQLLTQVTSSLERIASYMIHPFDEYRASTLHYLADPINLQVLFHADMRNTLRCYVRREVPIICDSQLVTNSRFITHINTETILKMLTSLVF